MWDHNSLFTYAMDVLICGFASSLWRWRRWNGLCHISKNDVRLAIIAIGHAHIHIGIVGRLASTAGSNKYLLSKKCISSEL